MSVCQSDAVVELLLRYELDEIPARVRVRLAELFADPPDDVLERLDAAAAYLGLDGSGVADAAARLDARLDLLETI